MKKTIDVYEFANAFQSSDTYKNNFTRAGLMALYDYLTEYEDSAENELELDVVAFCCEFSEYESLEQAYKDHYGDDSDLPEEQRRTTDEQYREYFEDNTTLIEFDGGVIIAQF